jgi:hypothetical protein
VHGPQISRFNCEGVSDSPVPISEHLRGPSGAGGSELLVRGGESSVVISLAKRAWRLLDRSNFHRFSIVVDGNKSIHNELIFKVRDGLFSTVGRVFVSK